MVARKADAVAQVFASWFTRLDKTVQAALITAVVTVLSIFLKDLLVTAWHNRRKARQDALAVLQRYADPLGSAATGLLYRLNEILNSPERGAYLRADAPQNPYNFHKRLSTVYRIAAVIGWIRAIRREQSYLRTGGRTAAARVHEALNAFEAALADGPAVETERLRRFAQLWNRQLPADATTVERLGVLLEQTTDKACVQLGIPDCASASGDQREKLCRAVASILSRELKAEVIPDAIVRETCEQGFQILKIREAWIFRDWQTAIGDLMLTPVQGSTRRFDVLGYGSFEEQCINGTTEQQKWFGRLAEVIDDLDVTLLQADDARKLQLQKLLSAVGQTITALAEADSETMFSKNTLSLARKVATPTSRTAT